MKTLAEIQKLSAPEVREWVKEVDKTLLIELVEEHPEEMMKVLLSSKSLPKEVVSFFESNNKLSELMTYCLSYDFCPSYESVEKLLDQDPIDGNLIHLLITKFPTLPITIQFLMRLLNSNVSPASITVFLARPEFQKSELIILMHKNSLEDSRLEEISLNNPQVVDFIFDNLSKQKRLDSFSTSLLVNLLTKHPHPKNFEYELVALKCPDFPFDLRESLMESYVNQKRSNDVGGYRSYSRRSNDSYLDWSSDVEQMDESIFKNLKVINAPINSKYRISSVDYEPSIAEDDEIVEIAQAKYAYKSDFARNLLSRPLKVIEKLDLGKIESALGPVEFADAVSRNDVDHKKKLYLYEKVSAKFRPALYKELPLGLAPEQKSTRKTSYYFEAFDALKRRNLQVFRESLSNGYDISQFAKDSHQSSKARSCELLSLHDDFVGELNKVEFLALCKTPISMPRYFNEGFKLAFTLTAEEAVEIKEKMGIDFAYNQCNEQEKLLSHKGLDSEDLSSIYRNNLEQINQNPQLLKAYLSASKHNGDLELTTEMLKGLSPILDYQELKELGEVSDYDRTDCINIKAKDGVYYISDKELLSMLTQKGNLESIDFLERLKERDFELLKKTVDAYLGGNKDLSALTGEKVNIKRQGIDKITKFKETMEQDPQDLVEQIFAEGGKLADFKDKLFHWRDLLIKYGNNREVLVETQKMENLSDLDIPNVTVRIQTLEVLVGNSYGNLYPEEQTYKLKIDNLLLGERALSEKNLEIVQNFMKEYGIADSQVSLDIDPDDMVELMGLVMANSPWVNAQEVIAQSLMSEDLAEKANLEILTFLENHGLILTEKLVYSLIDSKKDSPEVMKWLASRIGNLNDYVIGERDTRFMEAEEIELLKSLGLNIIEDEKLAEMELENKLQMEGANFSPISVEDMSLKGKTNLVKFIENEIDPNYAKLDLMSANLDTVTVLMPYETMKNIYSLDDQDLIRQLHIPSNLMNNKKALKGIRDFLTLKGGGFIYKVDSFKQAVAAINTQVEFTLADFINYDNVSEIDESENLKSISIEVISTILAHKATIARNENFLKNQKKAGILKFMRTASNKDASYIRDILQMTEAILQGLENLKERVQTLKDAGEGESDTVVELINSITSVESRLAEVAVMDDAVHMHDRLVPLQSFMKSDPLQPLGQDKFKTLEKSLDARDDLGFHLFFPKTRGDLQYLGDENGWCVNHHKSYGDGVIEKGNILVGLCEKNKPAEKENVIALAHYINKGNNSYTLEQLKWSSKKKNGSKNVDATNSFNSGKIIAQIKEHLVQYDKTKRKK